MKKLLIIVLIPVVAFAILNIATSLCDSFNNEEDAMTVAEQGRITESEAEKLCFSVMGEYDEATGFPFSFGVTSTFERNGKEYYAIRATWLVNNSHMSYVGDFFVCTDGNEIYSGYTQGDEYIFDELIWSKSFGDCKAK